MNPTKPVEPMPCPFCGGEPGIVHADDAFYVYCKTANCHCVVGELTLDGWTNHRFHTREDAFEAWNKRIPPPPAPPSSLEQKAVSHGMPKEVVDMLEACNWCNDGTYQGTMFQLLMISSATHIRAAYAKIAELESTIEGIESEVSRVYWNITNGNFTKANTLAVYILDEVEEQNKKDFQEIRDLTSQLSTLKAQMKEVIMRGDEMASSITWGEFIRQSRTCEAWKAATAALRQSGQGETE